MSLTGLYDQLLRLETTYKRNFSFHLGLSVAFLTEVARMNLAGRAAWMLSRCSRPCRLQVLLELLLLPLLLQLLFPVVELGIRLDRPAPPIWLVPILLPPELPAAALNGAGSFRLKLKRKLECFLSRSIGTIETRDSRLSPDMDGVDDVDEWSSSLEPIGSSCVNCCGDDDSDLLPEQQPGWMPSMQYGSLKPVRINNSSFNLMDSSVKETIALEIKTYRWDLWLPGLRLRWRSRWERRSEAGLTTSWKEKCHDG